MIINICWATFVVRSMCSVSGIHSNDDSWDKGLRVLCFHFAKLFVITGLIWYRPMMQLLNHFIYSLPLSLIVFLIVLIYDQTVKDIPWNKKMSSLCKNKELFFYFCWWSCIYSGNKLASTLCFMWIFFSTMKEPHGHGPSGISTLVRKEVSASWLPKSVPNGWHGHGP